jgi:hypothetical protein
MNFFRNFFSPAIRFRALRLVEAQTSCVLGTVAVWGLAPLDVEEELDSVASSLADVVDDTIFNSTRPLTPSSTLFGMRRPSST